MNTFGVIMAGGGGTRFWPLSRQKRPKQLLNLTGNDVMVNEAIDRLVPVVGNGNVFVVTNVSQVPAMLEVTAGRIQPSHILSEPVARNTTACIGYAAIEIIKKYGDGIMIITPADHYIKNVPELTRILELAAETAEHTDKLITIGIKPTCPSTGFGYIKCESTSNEVKPAVAFKEKPDEMTAKKYAESGDYSWNSGMFVWKASVILSKIKKYVPEIYADLEKIGNKMNSNEEKITIEAIYPRINCISIDYAVMESCAADGDVLVIPGEFGWNDVGSLDMLGTLHEQDSEGNIQIGDTLAVDTINTILYSTSKTVAAVGVENLIIVETADSIMVCRKDDAQSVKKIVDELKTRNRMELL